MKHFYKLLLILFLIPAFSFAQSNYKPGFVVTLNGDTIKGFIDYRDWDRNPKTIAFKKALAENQKQQYSTNNITAFEVNDYESYKRFVGWISQDKLSGSFENIGLDTAKKLDTVFLRIINPGGPLSLYIYKDIKKERFFICDNNTAPFELIYHEYYQEDNNGHNELITQPGYKLQLKRLAIKYQPGNADVIKQIQNTAFDGVAIKKIVSEINGAHSYLQNNRHKREGSRFFAGIGVNNSVISFGADNAALRKANSTSLFPEINIGTDIFTNNNVRTIGFRLELSFIGNHANTTGHTKMDGLDYFAAIKFDQYILSINPQVLYNFYNTDKIKIYVAGGSALICNAITNREYKEYIKDDNGTNVDVSSGFPGLAAIAFSITTKIGCEINKKFSVFTGYSPATLLNANFGNRVYLKSYSAGINYFFGK